LTVPPSQAKGWLAEEVEQRDLKELTRVEEGTDREREAREAAAYAHSLEAELVEVPPPPPLLLLYSCYRSSKVLEPSAE